MFNKIFLKEQALIYNIKLNDEQCEQFLYYANFLIEENKKYNLTGITEINEIVIKHFLDSMTFFKFFKFNDRQKLLDVGSGAGFPGLVLKISYPKLNVVLLDSLNKRVNFLNSLIDNLNLKGVSAYCERAEDLSKDSNFRESFDFVTARAVSNLSILSELCVPFVKIGGLFISMKAKLDETELKSGNSSLKKLGCSKAQIYNYKLCNEFDRTFVYAKKISQTLSKYPRKYSQITKKPLI